MDRLKAIYKFGVTKVEKIEKFFGKAGVVIKNYEDAKKFYDKDLLMSVYYAFMFLALFVGIIGIGRFTADIQEANDRILVSCLDAKVEAGYVFEDAVTFCMSDTANVENIKKMNKFNVFDNLAKK